ncbi:hypothetical protein [Sinomonas sp. P47F7]|uniref:hypothetical protein n=1 Tax=Sinomonas sp. P47F7 TaxID=3410987 RepID=UPI003BF47A3B
MSQSIDVGTVLGGRYKVTSSIVQSHDGDLVLDGVDQILNRPVSILVSAPANAEQLAQSAREVATGERPIGIQVLDLGVSHGATYLITNHAAAADLLDLIVAHDAPYVEPFFTDTLGSEIFGEARSNEPETFNGLYEHGSHDYIQYEPEDGQETGEPRPAQPGPRGGSVPPPPSAPPQSANRATAAGIAAAAAAAAASSQSPAPPKVTPWSTPPRLERPRPPLPRSSRRPRRRQRRSRSPARPSPRSLPRPLAEDLARLAAPRSPPVLGKQRGTTHPTGSSIGTTTSRKTTSPRDPSPCRG